MRLRPQSAKCEMLLKAQGLRVASSDEARPGDPRLDGLIRDGSAPDMRFDIRGSMIASTAADREAMLLVR